MKTKEENMERVIRFEELHWFVRVLLALGFTGFLISISIVLGLSLR